MSNLRLTVSSFLVAVLGLTTAHEASACGGLFCSTASPVNQVAERIVFAQDGVGTTSAIIEIKYQGPSERFAWVLPVPGVPEVGLSSKQALDRLQGQTEPQYQVRQEYSDECTDQFGGDGDGDGDGDGAQDAGASGPEFVHVLSSGTAGPYDFNVISIDAEADEPVQKMLDWLSTNDYDVSSLGGDLLGEYVAQGMNFLAVRLNKSARTGSIRPIRLTYHSERPLIPIRPTAVAADPDMGVLTWVLGGERAIPANYYSLELNDALINWFNWRSNYDEVVIAAADEAGGHGFVTEYAGPGTIAERSIWWPGAQQTRDWLGEQDQVRTVLVEAAINFGTLDGFVDAVRETVALREGVSAEEFAGCAECYFYPEDEGWFPDGGTLEVDDPVYTTDINVFLAALDRLVVDPMRETQELIDQHDYMTRLYTTLSPDEMTVDPEFDFNPDIAGVSNRHTVTQHIDCDGAGTLWTIELPSGLRVSGNNLYSWPIGLDEGLPFNLRVLQYSTSGAGELITDNLDPIQARLAELPPPTPLTRGEPGTGSTASTAGAGAADAGPTVRSSDVTRRSDCSCRVVGQAVPAWGGALWAVGLAGLFVWRRRTASALTG